MEAANLWVCVIMVKGDAELKLSHSMLKYNYLFVAPNLSSNVIAFMGDRPLEGRPWVFKIPWDKPWAWTEIKFLSNSIEMQTHFSQEGNLHAMWDTTGNTNLTTRKFPSLAVVSYAAVGWLSEGGRTPNEFRVWLEEMIITERNCQKEYWQLFFKFEMAAAQMDINDKKRSILDMEVETVTATDPKFWKWADQILDDTLGTRPTIPPVINRGGTSHIDQSFWENLTKVMGSGIGAMLQAQHIQHQPTATPSAQAGRREFYSDWALTELMGYSQVYTESGIQRIWGKFQISKECADSRQKLMTGMVYWANTNGVEIYTAVFFVKMEIEEMVNTKFNPGGPVAMYESAESGISLLMVIPRTNS